MLRILFLTAVLGLSVNAGAGELDNEKAVVNAEQKQLAADLPATVVVRINKQTGKAEVLHSKDLIPGDESSKNLLAAKGDQFKAIAADQVAQGELDRDSSTASWHFYFGYNNYYYPTYYYYGYQYQYSSYYSYSWGAYSYYYYSWYYRRW